MLNKTYPYYILTFATKDTPYEEVFFKYLQPSLDKFSLPYIYRLVENRKSWFKNVAYKPEVILEELNRNSFDLVFIDVDAEVVEEPVLFEQIPKEYDIAVHFLNRFQWYGHSPGVKELLSGTMFLRNNDKVKRLVKDWLTVSQRYQIVEQQCLEAVLKYHPDIKVLELPIEYIWIKTLPDGSLPKVKCDKPIVVHNQISRKIKKLIGR